MLLALLIHPGDVSVKQGFLKEMTEMNITKAKSSGSPKDAFTDLLRLDFLSFHTICYHCRFRNLFTENLFRSMFQQQKHQLDGTIQWVDGMNVLGRNKGNIFNTITKRFRSDPIFNCFGSHSLKFG